MPALCRGLSSTVIVLRVMLFIFAHSLAPRLSKHYRMEPWYMTNLRRMKGVSSLREEAGVGYREQTPSPSGVGNPPVSWAKTKVNTQLGQRVEYSLHGRSHLNPRYYVCGARWIAKIKLSTHPVSNVNISELPLWVSELRALGSMRDSVELCHRRCLCSRTFSFEFEIFHMPRRAFWKPSYLHSHPGGSNPLPIINFKELITFCSAKENMCCIVIPHVQ